MKKRLLPYYTQLRAQKERIIDQLFGSREYKKFVVISDSRTGSTLLMHFLNSHPEIICLGEEFKYLKESSCREIWNRIFHKRPKSVNWVGFKLFYFHPSSGNDNEVWDFIEKDKEIVIIHLTRINILRSYVSKQVGLKTRMWTENIKKPNNITKDDKLIRLDFDGCKENFESVANYRDQTEQRFKTHKVIAMIYEDLAQSKQKTMDKVFQELGVADFKVSTNMKKQNPESLKELVVNYSEIKDRFKNTEWEFLFNLED